MIGTHQLRLDLVAYKRFSPGPGRTMAARIVPSKPTAGVLNPRIVERLKGTAEVHPEQHRTHPASAACR
jgi:hypothetical protein